MWKLSYKLTKQFNNPEFKCPLKVAVTIKSKLEKFKVNIPFIQVLSNPGLKQRHWDAICKLTNLEITPSEETNIREFLKYEQVIEKNFEEIYQISNTASKEYTLEQALRKMKAEWETIQFTFLKYKDTDLHILIAYDDIFVLLEDHIVKTSTIKNSIFLKPFEHETNQWMDQLVK
jgi:dynein heavy chain